MDLGDTAWAYNNKKHGVKLYWEKNTYAWQTEATASSFGAGQLALAGIAGLILGLLGATAVLLPRRKRREDGTA